MWTKSVNTLSNPSTYWSWIRTFFLSWMKFPGRGTCSPEVRSWVSNFAKYCVPACLSTQLRLVFALNHAGANDSFDGRTIWFVLITPYHRSCSNQEFPVCRLTLIDSFSFQYTHRMFKIIVSTISPHNNIVVASLLLWIADGCFITSNWTTIHRIFSFFVLRFHRNRCARSSHRLTGHAKLETRPTTIQDDLDD